MFTTRITPFIFLLALSWLVTAAPVFQTENQRLPTVKARSFDQLDAAYGVRHLDDRDVDLHDQNCLHKRETAESSSSLKMDPSPNTPMRGSSNQPAADTAMHISHDTLMPGPSTQPAANAVPDGVAGLHQAIRALGPTMNEVSMHPSNPQRLNGCTVLRQSEPSSSHDFGSPSVKANGNGRLTTRAGQILRPAPDIAPFQRSPKTLAMDLAHQAVKEKAKRREKKEQIVGKRALMVTRFIRRLQRAFSRKPRAKDVKPVNLNRLSD
ncbi:hypothetical protein DACRYDRAFT_107042 [Dacryopinax primogenitus]|uniref:Uncharacterized protein n=1 Tax=Dacryopinax primogenitus (strain DJM 731) TaxID=1858805 RepID=M5GD19_DACPD|nr:uncharacterized protein DACRYDRAFT_107042 [Dacryopinax primogenitus]EJU02098.1 hypothetical protein DACRYDRAFT_107042 [Dacryopinax primogenitus]